MKLSENTNKNLKKFFSGLLVLLGLACIAGAFYFMIEGEKQFKNWSPFLIVFIIFALAIGGGVIMGGGCLL